MWFDSGKNKEMGTRFVDGLGGVVGSGYLGLGCFVYLGPELMDLDFICSVDNFQGLKM